MINLRTAGLGYINALNHGIYNSRFQIVNSVLLLRPLSGKYVSGSFRVICTDSRFAGSMPTLQYISFVEDVDYYLVL